MRRRAKPASPDSRICEVLLERGGMTRPALHVQYGLTEITEASLTSHLYGLWTRGHISKERAREGNVFTLTALGIRSIDMTSAARAKMEHGRQFKGSFELDHDPALVVKISRDHLRLIVDRALEAPLPLTQETLAALAAASKEAA